MSDTQTSTVQTQSFLANSSLEEREMAFFLETIVRLITGYSIAEIPTEKQEETCKKAVEIFNKFIVSYIEKKYGLKDAVRLKANQQYPKQEIFSKFPDLGPKFDEALDAFADAMTA